MQEAYNPTLCFISSIFREHFHILISSPRCYNVFKAAPIVAYRRSSNLSDFLVRAKLHNVTRHNQPRGSYPCRKNRCTCKNISDRQTSDTFHATGEKPDLSLITAHWHDTRQPLLQTMHYVSKTALTMNTADQLKTHVLSLNPPQRQNTLLLMITLITSHLSH